jgi:putative tryptophan/tyrosine transport system substrate-binding protein
MRRRAFIALLATTTVLPRFANAETKGVKVGILVIGNRDPASFVTAFKDEMSRLGYMDGRDIRFELRSGEAGVVNLRQLANDLVKAKVDVIVARLTPAVLAAKDATSEIPIVMIGAGDPIGNGLIASLARPGGNVTGLGGHPELIAKNIELVRELLPSAKRLGVIANAGDAFTKSFLAQTLRLAAENSGST